jgi:hypothetical protein
MGPRGPALETRYALGIERVHDIAHGLFAAAADLAGNPRSPGALLAGQHDLVAPHEIGIGGPKAGLQASALFGG